MSLSLRSGTAVANVMSRLERAWFPNEVTNLDESWDYQAWPVDEFLYGLELAATLTEGRKFVDVGSGIGTKLALASEMGWEPHGIEFRPQYAAMTSYICPEARVAQIDARVVQTYGNFDLIYAYLPLRSPRMRGLESTISLQAKPSAVLFFPEIDDLDQLGWKRVERTWLWVRR